MQEILKTKGMKATPARKAILDIFAHGKVPLDAEAIQKELRKNKIHKNINEATIYRTLSSFEENGVLKKVDLRKGSIHFELASESTHHHHIICTNCETVEDFKITELEKSLRRIVENSSNFKIIKDHSLEIFGLCRACI